VPLNATLEADPVASLNIFTLPFADPAADGANCTLTDVL
jgi:hypothetical protein